MRDFIMMCVCCIIISIAAINGIVKIDNLNSRVKELETENKMLREKIKETKFPKPSIRMYKPKCNCSCGERSSALRPLWLNKYLTFLLSRNKTDAKQTKY